MAYRIVYGEGTPQRSSLWKNRLAFQVMTAGILLLFMLSVRFWWQEGTEVLRRLLLPGEPGATEIALQTLVERVSAGEPVGEAVTAFCREIVANAKLAG